MKGCIDAHAQCVYAKCWYDFAEAWPLFKERRFGGLAKVEFKKGEELAWFGREGKGKERRKVRAMWVEVQIV